MNLELYIESEFIDILKSRYGANHRADLTLEQLNDFIEILEHFARVSKILDSESKPLKLNGEYYFAGDPGKLRDVTDDGKFVLIEFFDNNPFLEYTKIPSCMVRRCRESERRILKTYDYTQGKDVITTIIRWDFHGRTYITKIKSIQELISEILLELQKENTEIESAQKL